MLVVSANDGFAQRSKYNKNHSKHRTTRVAKKKGKKSKKSEDELIEEILSGNASGFTLEVEGDPKLK